MKTKLIICSVLLLLVSGFVAAQAINIWTPKTVVLYRGIENPIALNLCGVALSDIQLSTNEGVVINNKDGKLSVFIPVDYKEDELIITIEHQKGKQENNTTLNHLKVRDLPTPIISLGNLDPKEHTFKKEEVLSNLSFTISAPDYFPYDVKYTIKSYEFLTISEGGVVTSMSYKGDKIDAEFMETIKNDVQKHHKIAFANMILEGPEGIIVKTGLSINVFDGWE